MGAAELCSAIRSAPSSVALELASKEGTDVNALTDGGDSPLVCAASAGRIDIVDALLKAGASPDSCASTGSSALAAASMAGHVHCVRRLLAAGATVDLGCGRSNSTALLQAAQNGHRGVCEVLVAAGADAQKVDAFGDSAESAAHRFEVDARLYASDFAQWGEHICKEAAAIGAEPPPKPSLFPLRLRDDIKRWHTSTDPTKRLWRPGEWLHQKRPASKAVLDQSRPRNFSATGYDVAAVRIPPEHSVLPAERLAVQHDVRAMQGEEGAGLASAVALERSSKNPQLFNDDVSPTLASLRHTITDAAGAFSAIDRQQEYVHAAFPTVPTHLGKAPVYSSGLQRTAMPTPTAAASLVPMLEEPPLDGLSALLRKSKKEEEEAAPPAEEEVGKKPKK